MEYKNKETISVLGCGWLGLPLALNLVKQGFFVKGSTTTFEKVSQIEEIGVLPFILNVSDTSISGMQLKEFFHSDIMIVNIPPKRRENVETYHIKQFDYIIKELEMSTVKKIILVSSTSVYPDLNKEIFETEIEQPTKGSGKALRTIENRLLDNPKFEVTVLRFSGLIGYDRMPGRFLAGKTNIENGKAPINVIHQDDCVSIITELIKQNVWGDVFNVSSDVHPTRENFYTIAAKKANLAPPEFLEQTSLSFKLINSDKIKNRLNYKFKYANPLDAI